MILDAHGGDIYTHREAALDFSVNLNPLGMPEAVRQAVRDCVSRCDVYPDPHCRALRAATAAREGVPEEQLVFGNGAADLIVRIAAAVRPRQTLVPAPTFSEYERAARQQGSAVRRAALSEADGWQLRRSFAEEVRPGDDLVFLCNPNNPTCRLAEPGAAAAVLAACERVGAILVVDECFLEFTEGASCKSLHSQNLVILRAFTKLYSMAGLRLGYLLCENERLRAAIEGQGQCWSVSTPAQAAGTAALTVTDYPERTREFLRRERPFLADSLRELGFFVYPSDGNFLLFRGDPGLWERALRRGILLRSCANFPPLGGEYYRAGLKTRPEHERLLSVLRESR